VDVRACGDAGLQCGQLGSGLGFGGESTPNLSSSSGLWVVAGIDRDLVSDNDFARAAISDFNLFDLRR
jgi:hypothetical protein